MVYTIMVNTHSSVLPSSYVRNLFLMDSMLSSARRASPASSPRLIRRLSITSSEQSKKSTPSTSALSPTTSCHPWRLFLFRGKPSIRNFTGEGRGGGGEGEGEGGEEGEGEGKGEKGEKGKEMVGGGGRDTVRNAMCACMPCVCVCVCVCVVCVCCAPCSCRIPPSP